MNPAQIPSLVFLLLLPALATPLPDRRVNRDPVEILVLRDRIVQEPLRFTGIDDDGLWRFQGTKADTALRVPADQLVWWGGPTTRISRSLVQTVDGTVVAGSVDSLDAESIHLSSSWWHPFRLPRDSVRSILMYVPASFDRREVWTQRIRQPLEQDRVWTVEGDFVDGKVLSIGDGGTLAMQGSEGTVRIPLKRIAAIVFSGAAANAEGEETAAKEPATKHEFSLVDGSRIRVSSITLTGDGLIARCPFGTLELKAKSPDQSAVDPARLVCGIRNQAADESFLSALEPLDYRHQPLLGRQVGFGRNRSVTGGQLTCGQTAVPFGIGMPSRSSLVYRLDRPVKSLQFGLAMDSSTGLQGSVVCKVLALRGDNRQWETVWTSPVIRGGSAIQLAEVPLTGATALALAVDYSDRGDLLDRVNWLMPRLVRE